MSELKLEQHTNIKSLMKLSNTDYEIREMLVYIYEENAMKKLQFTIGLSVFF